MDNKQKWAATKSEKHIESLKKGYVLLRRLLGNDSSDELDFRQALDNLDGTLTSLKTRLKKYMEETSGTKTSL